MRGEEVILINFPISHFLKSLAHSAMVFNCIQWYSLVFNGIHWYSMVFNGLGWSQMVLDGLRWPV